MSTTPYSCLGIGCRLFVALVVATAAFAIPALAPAAPQCDAPFYTVFELEFTPSGAVHRASLQMRGCKGAVVVTYYSEARRAQEAVVLEVQSVTTPLGPVLMTSNPISVTTGKPSSTYSPDNFLIRREPNGGVTFLNCDLNQVCVDVRLLSQSPLVNLVVQNDCSREVSVAAVYHDGLNIQRRQGWWKVRPGNRIATDAWIRSDSVHVYAEAGTLQWTGANSQPPLTATVVNASFDIEHGDRLSGAGLHEVTFFRRNITPAEQRSGQVVQSFTCNGQ